MQTNDERLSWQEEITILVSKAMQVAVMTWEDKTIAKMPNRERAQLMAQLAADFGERIVEVAQARSSESTSTQ